MNQSRFRALLLSGMLGTLPIVAATGAFAQGAAVESASAQQKQAAQAKYTEGTRLFSAEKFAEAYKAFEASYGIVASPNSALMMGRALKEQGKAVAAYEQLEIVKADAAEAAKSDQRYAATASKADEILKELKAEVGFVTLDVQGGDGAGAVSVNGKDVPPSAWSMPVLVSPGPVEIVGSFAGAPRDTQKVEVAKGATAAVSIDLRAPVDEPAPIGPIEAPDDGQPDGGSTLVPWILVSGGFALAGWGVFTVAGVLNQTTHADLVDRCGPGGSGCAGDFEAVVDRGEREQLIANIGFGVGVGFTVLTGVLIGVELASDDDSDVGVGGELKLGGGLGPDGSSLTLSGSF